MNDSEPLNRPDYQPIDPDHPAMVGARARAAHRCGAVHGVLAHIPMGSYDLDLEAAARAFIASRDDYPWPLAETIGAGVERAWPV